MKLSDVLYCRQYKIRLSSAMPELDLNSLKEFGIWIHPVEKQYILTLQSSDDPNKDPIVFERNFSKKTGLMSTEYEIEAKYGPMTFQGAVDDSWI